MYLYYFLYDQKGYANKSENKLFGPVNNLNESCHEV